MATPVDVRYAIPATRGVVAGSFAGGRLAGSVLADAMVAAGLLTGNTATITAPSLAMDDLVASGAFTGYFSVVPDDNLMAGFNEGTSTSGWSVTSGSGALSQASSSVRLTSSAAAVTSQIAISGATANDFVLLAKLSAQYVSGQSARVRLMAGATAVLDIALGYDFETGAAALGTVSAYSTPASSGNNIATGVNYETTPQELLIHVDRNYNAVNLFIRETGGKWDFRGSFAYAANFAALDTVQLVTSAHNAQWIEYDWLGYARLNFTSIGDSINAGHNGFDPDPSVYAGEDNYNSAWQKHAKIFPELRNNYIASKGIGGQTSTQILSRMSWATAHGARLVFLHASTNDQVNAVSKATRTSNIQASVNAITASGAACVLLNALYGTAGNSINPAHRDYMLDWWTTALSSITGLNSAINIQTPIDTGANYMAGSKAADGIHPNATGYQDIGTAIATHTF